MAAENQQLASAGVAYRSIIAASRNNGGGDNSMAWRHGGGISGGGSAAALAWRGGISCTRASKAAASWQNIALAMAYININAAYQHQRRQRNGGMAAAYRRRRNGIAL